MNRCITRCLPGDVLGAEAAKLIAQRLTESVEIGEGPILIGAPGGTSISCLKELARTDWPEEVRQELLQRLHYGMVDQYVVQEGRLDANIDAANNAFLRALISAGILAYENVHYWMFSDESNPEQDVKNYEEMLYRLGHFQLIILGVGGGTFADGTTDLGHIAGILPVHEHLWSLEGMLGAYTQQPLKKAPAVRATLLPRYIKSCGADVIAILRGEAKQAALDAFLDQNIGEVACPLKLIKNRIHGDSFLFTDLQNHAGGVVYET